MGGSIGGSGGGSSGGGAGAEGYGVREPNIDGSVTKLNGSQWNAVYLDAYLSFLVAITDGRNMNVLQCLSTQVPDFDLSNGSPTNATMTTGAAPRISTNTNVGRSSNEKPPSRSSSSSSSSLGLSPVVPFDVSVICMENDLLPDHIRAHFTGLLMHLYVDRPPNRSQLTVSPLSRTISLTQQNLNLTRKKGRRGLPSIQGG